MKIRFGISRSIGKSGFRFSKSKSEFPNRTHPLCQGRKRQGGIRFGEMERDALLAHGTSFLLQDRLMNCSDRTVVRNFVQTLESLSFTYTEKGEVIVVTIFYKEAPSRKVVYIEVLKLDIYYIIIQKTIYKLELKKEYINIYNIYITKIKNSNNNNNKNSNSNNNNNN